MPTKTSFNSPDQSKKGSRNHDRSPQSPQVTVNYLQLYSKDLETFLAILTSHDFSQNYQYFEALMRKNVSRSRTNQR